jgi:hypothetical protein
MSGYNRESLRDDTNEYVGDLCKLIADPYNKSVSGNMASPGSASGARIYVSEGSGTISAIDDTVKNIVVVYDPEATLRRGQAQMIVFERNSAGVVKKVSAVKVGRSSTDFLAAGVVSSALTVKNTSSVDQIAGAQTQATLYSVPKTIKSLTASDLLQFATDKDSHLISNVTSKMDHTVTNSPTDHNGVSMALLRDKAFSNNANITFNVAASLATAAQGFTQGGAFPVTGGGTDAGKTAQAAAAVGATLPAASITNALFDSSLDLTKSPFALDTYKADASFNLSIQAINNAAASDVVFTAYALAADDTVLAAQSVLITADAANNAAVVASLNCHLESDTLPIDRLVLTPTLGAAAVAYAVERDVAGVSSGIITANSETADIPGRGIHVCVLEGVNSGASINVHGANVISGVPDSDNAFISNSTSSDKVYDFSQIQGMLATFKHTIPRAFTGMGASATKFALQEWFSSEGMNVAMEAMSFRRIGRAFKQIGGIAKEVRRGASTAAGVAQPLLKVGGTGLMMYGGARGKALGAGMLATDQGIDAARATGVLER